MSPVSSGVRVGREGEDAMKYNIGDILADEDGNAGTVVIQWDDGDICETEETAAHLKPVVIIAGDTREKRHEISRGTNNRR